METVLVIGAARSGIAVAQLLQNKGYHVVLTDAQSIPEKEELLQKGMEVYDQGHPDELKTRDYAFIVKNPGIPYKVPFIKYFVEKEVPIYTEIEIAYRSAPYFEYAALTGTDGKTTTIRLLEAMLLKKDPGAIAAGNIGLPLSEVVLEKDDSKRMIALELSNFQLLGIDSFRPRVSAMTNLAPDHLDYMGSLEDYYASKFKIFENCTEDDVFIRNIDDPIIMEYFNNPQKNFFGRPKCQIVDFSLTSSTAALRRENQIVWLDDIALFDEKDLKLVGLFNLGNAMMAAAMAYFMGVTPSLIQEAIREFKGVEHRIEFVDEINGVRIYNDSKATNTHAAQAALSSFDNNVILLCGGKDKGIDYTDLKQYDSSIKHCFSFGEIKDVFKTVFQHQTSVNTMEQALDQALQIAQPGDVILLCPATSSFDQFKNYEVRGNEFKRLVKERNMA